MGRGNAVEQDADAPQVVNDQAVGITRCGRRQTVQADNSRRTETLPPNPTYLTGAQRSGVISGGGVRLRLDEGLGTGVRKRAGSPAMVIE